MFATVLYVQARLDRFSVRNVSKGTSVERTAQPSFSHQRSLVGDFTIAQALLKELVAEAKQGFSLKTEILIHPMERVEGGLTQIEERVFRELCAGAGASRVAVWVGAPLSDAQVLEKLRAA